VVPGERLSLRATFARRRLDAAAVERHLGHLAAFLHGLAALAAGDPAAPRPTLGALPLLSPAERHQLLLEWQDRPDAAIAHPAAAAHDAAAAPLLHLRLAAVAAAAPDAAALVEAD